MQDGQLKAEALAQQQALCHAWQRALPSIYPSLSVSLQTPSNCDTQSMSCLPLSSSCLLAIETSAVQLELFPAVACS